MEKSIYRGFIMIIGIAVMALVLLTWWKGKQNPSSNILPFRAPTSNAIPFAPLKQVGVVIMAVLKIN